MVEREEHFFPLKEVCPAMVMAMLPGWRFSARKYRTHPERSEARSWTFESPVFEANTIQREGINMTLELKPDEGKLDLELRVNWDRRFAARDFCINEIFLGDSEIAFINENSESSSLIDRKREVIDFNPNNPSVVHFTMGSMRDSTGFLIAPIGLSGNEKLPLAPMGIPYKLLGGRRYRGPR